MEYTKKRYTSLNTEADISTFSTLKSDVAESMIMIRSTENNPLFESQLTSIIETFYNISESLKDSKPIAIRVFLSDAANQAALVKQKFMVDCMLSIVEQPPLNSKKIAVWAYFQSNVDVSQLDNGLFKISHNGYDHFWSTALPALKSDSYNQTVELFDNYCNNQLQDIGATLFSNTIRTWLFVQNVDVNYSGVVEGRNFIFDREGLTNKTHFITSTGIQGRISDHNVTTMMDAYSITGISENQIQYLYAATHLNSTYEYGVRFERGVAVHYGDRSHLFISGTASIDNKGEVVHVGDIKKQTFRMLENVEVLLNEGECDYSNVAQMIIYLRDLADYDIVHDIFNTRFSDIPKVILLAPVCRPTWLIEIECIAIRPNNQLFPTI